jgi:hypothetical protein
VGEEVGDTNKMDNKLRPKVATILFLFMVLHPYPRVVLEMLGIGCNLIQKN